MLLKATEHRIWPPPRRSWFIAMCWRDLLFAHWPVPVESIRPSIPRMFEIDTYDGEAWLGVVPFRMTGFRNRISPTIPWAGAFAEINLRTYVRIGDRSGVYFFSLDTPRRLAVWGRGDSSVCRTTARQSHARTSVKQLHTTATALIGTHPPLDSARVTRPPAIRVSRRKVRSITFLRNDIRCTRWIIAATRASVRFITHHGHSNRRRRKSKSMK